MSEIANTSILSNPIVEEREEEEDPNSTVPRVEIGNIPEDEEESAWPTTSPLVSDMIGGPDNRISMGVPRRTSTSQRSTTGTIVDSPSNTKKSQNRRPSISAAIGSMFSKKKSVATVDTKKRQSSDDLPMSVSTANFFRETEARNSNDAFQLFSNAVLKNIEPTSLNVTWKGTSSIIKILLDRTAADLVLDIIEHLQLEKKGINPSGYRIAKIDHQNPGTFMWLIPHHESALYNLRHGDDLLLKYIAELDEITVEIPQFKAKKIIDIAWEDLTENIIDRIKSMYSIESSVVCGLYVPRLGMWLNAKKPILTYDLRSNVLLINKALQFRPMMDEFPVRISLSDFDQKFAIKVLPSFQVADVISIVGFQVNNRKLQLPPNRKYGLFLDDIGWMDENKEMSTYPTAKTQFLTFKVQERLAQLKFEGKVHELYFNATATVANLLESVIPNAEKRAQYALYNCYDEGYALNKTVWDTLADPSVDLLRVERKLIPVDIKCSRYGDASVEFLLSPDKPLEQYFERFSRKFGLTPDEIVRVTKEGEIKKDILSLANVNFDDLKSKSEAGLEIYSVGVPKMQLVGDIKFISSKPCLYLVVHNRTKAEPIPVSPEMEDKYTVSKLVSILIDGDQLEKHPNFVTAFLMTYATFTNPQEVIQELKKFYVVLNDQCLEWEQFLQYKKPIQLRICNFILNWTKKFCYDFNGPDGPTKIRLLLDFVEEYVCLDSLNLAKQIRKQLNKLSTDTKKPLQSNTTRDFEFSAETIMSHPMEKVAEQLTIIDYDIFSHVMPYEILKQAWTKSDADVRAPGIVALSKRFNTVANWVVESILTPKTSKARGERICKIIDLGWALYKLNNFSTLMAVIAGLNKAAITRLKISFKDVPSKQMQKKEELEAVMAPMGSYKRYRQEIQTAQPPCVPYIGTTLTDCKFNLQVTYTDDGNPDYIDGFINFEKRKQTSKLISELLYYQQTQYQLTVKGDIHSLLLNLPEASAAKESENWKLSKSLE